MPPPSELEQPKLTIDRARKNRCNFMGNSRAPVRLGIKSSAIECTRLSELAPTSTKPRDSPRTPALNAAADRATPICLNHATCRSMRNGRQHLWKHPCVCSGGMLLTLSQHWLVKHRSMT